jgi:hypothetical protein
LKFSPTALNSQKPIQLKVHLIPPANPGNKKDNITVIYTPWRNLHKQASMATGQIGFHRQKQVKKVHVEKRINEIINRLNKTRVEKSPDLAAEKAGYEKEERRKEKAALQEKVYPMLLGLY